MSPEVTTMWGSHKTTMPTTETALPGRAERMPVPATHHVSGRPLTPPFPAGMQTAIFGLGCFWGAEKAFWLTPGVFTTAVGYAAGLTPNPTYEEVCTGRTGHNEVVLVVFDPTAISYEALLRVFWEAHDPTQGMRQGNDVGTQYRSGIYVASPAQRAAAEASRDAYQRALTAAGRGLGPVRPRGGPSGLVVRGGHVVADWGDTERVEMSFSIAKSYLAALAGVAVAHGLIETIDDPVRDYATDNAFASEQNRAITWRHLLQQTSEWSGTLFGKPDSIDHHRDLGQADFGQTDKGVPRPMRPPGTLWEYNDVRVNRLSLSLLQLFRSPLADVLRDAIMAPIGASSTWEWRPYANAWVEIDGRQMPSVPGGSHWGGGLWMSARDHARFGLLHLRRGRWGDAQILPASWIDECRQPCAINPEYGLLWWLDVGRTGAWAARGAGSSLVWIGPDDDLVAGGR